MELSHPHTWSGVKFCDSFNSCELFPETMNKCSYVSLGSLKGFDSTISFLGGESLGSLLGGGSLSSLPPGFGSLEDFENDKENPETPCSTTQSLFRVSPISVRPSGFLCPPVAKLESADPTERQRRWTASINSRVRCPMSMDCCPVDEPSRQRAGTKYESSAGGPPDHILGATPMPARKRHASATIKGPKQFRRRRKPNRPWSEEEDTLLLEGVEMYGASKWTIIARHVGSRNGAMCAQRWRKNVRPELKARKTGKWERHEDAWLRELVRKHGCQGPEAWRLISKGMGYRRNERQCRDRWVKYLAINTK